tara:strand:- start:660 stop:2546 length:1887 start_codon:yes stop_codon:yes gene_type:complete
MKIVGKPTDLIRTSGGLWLESYGKIRDVGGSSFRPKLNVLQRRIDAIYTARKIAGKPCRIIGLKPRKKGFSTMAAAHVYHQCRQYPHEAVLMGDKEDTSGTVFRMISHYLETDQFVWDSDVEHAGLDEIRLSNRALIKMSTAKSRSNIRGMTPQYIHGTEVAHWEAAEVVLLGLMNAIPDIGFNCVVLESTPKGNSGAFFETWQGARWPRPDECPDERLYWKQWESMSPDNPPTIGAADADFVRVFAAWFEFEDSYIRLNEEEKGQVQDTLDSEPWHVGEQELIETYAVEREDGTLVLGDEVEDADVWEQLAWRRSTIRNKCKRDKNNMDQEYPRDPESCFLASGKKYFDVDAIRTLRSRIPEYRSIFGNLKASGAKEATFFPGKDSSSMFRIFEPPSHGFRYLLVVDPMTGADQTEGADDPDRHSALMLRSPYRDGDGVVHKGKVAARLDFPSTLPIYSLAENVDLLSRYYGRCVVCPEVNNSGLALIVALKGIGCPIWQRTHILDKANGVSVMKDGWQTTDTAGRGGVRSLILDALHEALREDLIEIPCPNIVHELSIFIRSANGKLEAPKGEHDDDVLALAIGWYNIDSGSIYQIDKATRKLPKEFKHLIDGAQDGDDGRGAHRW